MGNQIAYLISGDSNAHLSLFEESPNSRSVGVLEMRVEGWRGRAQPVLPRLFCSAENT